VLRVEPLLLLPLPRLVGQLLETFRKQQLSPALGLPLLVGKGNWPSREQGPRSSPEKWSQELLPHGGEHLLRGSFVTNAGQGGDHKKGNERKSITHIVCIFNHFLLQLIVQVV
jgi:hypothetical protein